MGILQTLSSCVVRGLFRSNQIDLPMPIFLTFVVTKIKLWLSTYCLDSDWMLTVQLCFLQSWKKFDAENFFLMTVVVPFSIADPVPIWPPEEW